MRSLAPVIVLLALLAAASPAAAATFTVTTTADSALPCTGTSCPSIRSALIAAEANGVAVADTIVVPAGNYQLSQAGSLLVDSDVTVRGASARATTIVAAPPARVFDVGAGVTVTLAQLTASGGTAANGANVLNQGTLTLDHVRVTGGDASDGGGGGIANESASLTILQSLIDDNHASLGPGGGIQSTGTTLAPATLTISDSTLSGNTALSAGAIYSSGTGNVTTLTRVTIANNSSGATPGGIDAAAQTIRVQGSILFNNRGDGVLSNCGTPVTSDGANVEDGTACGFTAAGDAQSTDPQLSPAPVNAGGQTDVLSIPSTSPALDRAGACTNADQRDLGRPQGVACDSGAFEVDLPPDTALSVAATSTPGASPTFTFSSTEPGVRFECRLDGGAFAGCASPTAYADLTEGAHTFDVRAVDSAGTPDPSPASNAFNVRPKAEFHEKVVIGLVSGFASYKPKGTSQFLPLIGSVSIPLGSKVNVREGRIGLTSEPAPGAPTERVEFYDGIFKVSQPGAITQLKLTEKLRRCPKAGQASATRRRKTRRLWGSGSGRFRTRGRYSAATVSGTEWLVKDSCRGTLTKVKVGTVSVRDKVRKKTVVVEAGERYLARPRRR